MFIVTEYAALRPTIYVYTCVPEYISLYMHRLYLIINGLLHTCKGLYLCSRVDVILYVSFVFDYSCIRPIMHMFIIGFQNIFHFVCIVYILLYIAYYIYVYTCVLEYISCSCVLEYIS